MYSWKNKCSRRYVTSTIYVQNTTTYIHLEVFLISFLPRELPLEVCMYGGHMGSSPFITCLGPPRLGDDSAAIGLIYTVFRTRKACASETNKHY